MILAVKNLGDSLHTSVGGAYNIYGVGREKINLAHFFKLGIHEIIVSLEILGLVYQSQQSCTDRDWNQDCHQVWHQDCHQDWHSLCLVF